jgi:hypothetical protein
MNLNEVLIKFGKGYSKSTYLEIGTQSPERLKELSSHFSHLYGVDEDSFNFTKVSKELIDHKNVTLLCGKSFRVPMNKYDVIVSGYQDTKEAVKVSITKNFSSTPFILVFLEPLDEEFKKK